MLTLKQGQAWELFSEEGKAGEWGSRRVANSKFGHPAVCPRSSVEEAVRDGGREGERGGGRKREGKRERGWGERERERRREREGEKERKREGEENHHQPSRKTQSRQPTGHASPTGRAAPPATPATARLPREKTSEGLFRDACIPRLGYDLLGLKLPSFTTRPT